MYRKMQQKYIKPGKETAEKLGIRSERAAI